ncbi:TerC/Alx family metal homeostasis membrane protein [Notoacmeibacter ruber]|uniref:TerC/Alx family metal homeostasis membrane protein n=1 Tax=Notoacmeibacter ruber TaxID=2670375 RepID=A0A3L7JC23_9HYPH|nr:TerC/Alx family metal homeostasis membrane protein [Notoacmeibacter ruber]RLQ88020.1 TerC/Alx family metal homeostasis membrane protein [Notoacmeibacter ruber]
MLDFPYLWPAFLSGVALLLFLDLFVFHRKAHIIGVREAVITWSCYVALAFLFAAALFTLDGPDAGSEFLTAYLIEVSLSLDNIFVIALIFKAFSVPEEAQHRVLFYGIAGAILIRLSLILPGAELVDRYYWIGYVLGLILLVSGAKMMFGDSSEEFDPQQSRTVRLLMKTGRAVDRYHGERFLIRRDGRYWMTPLFIVLVTVEVTDLIFAVDSIPAVLAVSDRAFIVFSSNVFAILGLRVLFFILAGVMRHFRFLEPALALILVLIGARMLLHEVVHVPSMAVLLGTLFILAGGIILSRLFPASDPEHGKSGPMGDESEARHESV